MPEQETWTQEKSDWIKASASYGHGDCVELHRDGENVLVRDSKHRDEVRSISIEMLADLVNGAKAGEFDHLLGGSGD